MLATLGSLFRKETSDEDSLLVDPHHILGYTQGLKMNMDLVEYLPMYRISTPGTLLIAPCHPSYKAQNLANRKQQLIKISIVFNLVLFALLLCFPLIFGGTYAEFFGIFAELLLN